MSDSTQTKPGSQRFWSRRETWIVALALAVLGVGVMAVPTAMAFRGLGGHGFGHDPERARERAAVGVEWAFRAVDATEEQRAEGKVVVDRVVDRLIPLGERHREHREAVARELVKPEVDRVVLDQLRREGMAMADEASRVVIDGVADLAEVLSPEQRVELLGLLHRFHHDGGSSVG